MRRYLFPLLLGVVGVAILVSLGTWQVRRLAWKEAILAEIESRIAAEPGPLPDIYDAGRDRWRPVTATGDLSGDEIHVLTSGDGAGYRVVAAFNTQGGRRVMADLGFVPLEAKGESRAASGVTVTGHLNWPQEVDNWTPAPDREENIWFARDVGPMAEALETEPLLIQAETVSGADLGVSPLPVDTSAIPNDHREYAITWFALAAVWAGMTGVWIRRIARGQGT